MWEWLEKAKSFIDRTINRVLGRGDIERLIVQNQAVYTSEVDALSESLLSGGLSVGAWEDSMRSLIKTNYLQMYMLGKGGRDQMGRKDFSSIGGMLGRDQYKYLKGFADAIWNGELTPGQIMARARMYVRSSREAYNRALGRAYGIPEGALPAYPGDGKSCLGLTNCACQWDIQETFDGWNAFWRLGDAEHCEVCLEHEREWAPFHIVREDG